MDYYQGREKPTNPLCTAALITRNNKILMGLREYEKGNPVWTLPGGRCDAGESLEDGLRREVAEEAGITDLKIIRLLGQKEGVWKEGVVPDQVYLYECKTEQEATLLEPEKFLKWEWFAKNEIPDNIIDKGDLEYITQVI